MVFALVMAAIKLSEFDLEYEPRRGIKGQVLAEFIVEIASFPHEELAVPVGKSWILFVDGSSCQAGRGLEIYLMGLDGKEYHFSVTLTFKITNNKVEYKVLFVKISMA